MSALELLFGDQISLSNLFKFQSTVRQNQSNYHITFNTQLKTALYSSASYTLQTDGLDICIKLSLRWPNRRCTMKSNLSWILQVGLAVGDIESIQRTASLRTLIDDALVVEGVMKSYPKFILRRVHRRFLEFKPNRNMLFKR